MLENCVVPKQIDSELVHKVEIGRADTLTHSLRSGLLTLKDFLNWPMQ